jgi:ABC-type branched-subunit amino acid transport system substrate-binding protein
MERKTHHIISLSFLVLVVVSFLGVSNFTTNAHAQPAVTSWNISVISTLTGPVAFAGLPAAWAADFAVKEINDAGGVKGLPIKITKYDDAFDTAKAVSAMSRAVQDALAVIGPIAGPGSKAVGSIAVEAGVPFMAAIQFPSIRQLFKPWGICAWQDSGSSANLCIAEWVKINPDIKSLVILYMPADPAHVEEIKEVEKELPKSGIKLLGKVEVEVGQLDLGPSAVRAMNLHPDGYYSTIHLDQYARLAIEMRKRGMTEGRRLLTGFASNAPSLYQLAKGYLEDTYIWDNLYVSYEGTRWQTLVEAYKRDHQGALPMLTPIPAFYDGVYAIKAAIETLGLTGNPTKLSEERIKIRDFLYNSKQLDGVQGKYRWVNGEKLYPVYLFQIHDNKPVRISTIEPRK